MTDETCARAVKDFNQKNSEDFVFLLSAESAEDAVSIQTADRIIVFDTDFDLQKDLEICGKGIKNVSTQGIEIYRLATADSVEQEIMNVAC